MPFKISVLTLLIFGLSFSLQSQAKNKNHVEKVMQTKSGGKKAEVTYTSSDGKQTLSLLIQGKVAYHYMANPPQASMTDFKVVKFSNFPRKVLFTHWLLGAKNQRIIVFDFHDSDSPIIFDLYSEDEIQYKILKDKIQATYLTYPNNVDGLEHSSQTVTWTPDQ